MNVLNEIKNKIKKNSFSFAYEGEKAFLEKNYKKALKLYNNAINYAEKNCKYLDLYYSSRAEIKRYLEDFYGALSDINQAIELQPTVYLYYFERSEIKNKLNDKVGAEEDLKTILNILDKNDSSHIFQIYLAEKRAKEGKFIEAAKLLDVGDKFNDSKYNNENVLNLKIFIHSNINDKEALIDDLNKMIEIYPLRTSYLEYKTNILIDLLKYNEALECINKAIELDISNGKLYLFRLIINYNLKNYDNAMQDADKALSLVLSQDDNNKCNFYKSKLQKILAG